MGVLVIYLQLSLTAGIFRNHMWASISCKSGDYEPDSLLSPFQQTFTAPFIGKAQGEVGNLSRFVGL